jgi:NADPH-dependent 2,4-dienoyl-CoA reductase/sulfur reductase-like enzyme
VRIPGTRPAGVYTAGTAQRFVNIEGMMVGKRAVVLGSGDIGLIMARRLTLEGAEVEGVYEILPHPSGLTRNVVQCLHDYEIPLHLSHTIRKICGYPRVESVIVQCVDDRRRPIPGTEREIPCDTVILSVGLIPENELSMKACVKIDPITGGPVVNSMMQTSVPSIFACGNVVHVYDLVDHVTVSAQRAALGAAQHVRQKEVGQQIRGRRATEANSKRRFPVLESRPTEPVGPGVNREIPIRAGEGVNHIVPHALCLPPQREEPLYFRVCEERRDCRIVVRAGEKVLRKKKERVVKPAEMVVFTLKQKHLRAIPSDADVITVEVTDG